MTRSHWVDDHERTNSHRGLLHELAHMDIRPLQRQKNIPVDCRYFCPSYDDTTHGRHLGSGPSTEEWPAARTHTDIGMSQHRFWSGDHDQTADYLTASGTEHVSQRVQESVVSSLS